MGMFDIPDWLPEDPAKHAAAKAGLLQLGAAMLGGRGNFGQMLGQGLNAGAAGYNGSLAQQQQAALTQAQAQHFGLQNQMLQGQIDEPMQLAKIAAGVGQPGASATSVAPVSSLPQLGASPQTSARPDMPAQSAMMPLSALPQMSAPDQAQAEPAPQAAPQAQGPAKGSYEYYLALAQAYATAGKNSAAQIAMKLASDMKPKLKETRVMTVDGKRVMANTFEDGTVKQINDFAPDMEKLNFQNTGGATLALDPFTGKPVNTIKNTQSPDSFASGQVQMRGQNMQDARSREANKVVAEAAMAPEYKQDTSGNWIALPKKVAPGQAITALPVMGTDGRPLAAAPKPLTETQGKATTFSARMLDAEKSISQLEAAGVKGNGARTLAAGSSLTNWAASPEGQMYRQAQENWVTANLRQESGAAIGKDEMEKDIRKYFPSVGDADKVIAQKTHARSIATQGMLTQAGPGADSARSIAGVAPLASLPKKAAAIPTGWAVKEH